MRVIAKAITRITPIFKFESEVPGEPLYETGYVFEEVDIFEVIDSAHGVSRLELKE